MLFNSVSFLIFLPIVAVVYFAIPKKAKWIWLLICSYYFYMSWNPQYAIFLGISTIITYLSGILISKSNQIENINKKNFQKKLWVILSAVSNLGILFFFKYFDFAVENMNALLASLNMQLITPAFDIILPVGISFYTFQSLTYTFDIYRGEVEVEKNLGKYALFVSFFPQIVSGPIGRFKNLLRQVCEPHYFDHERVKNGVLLMLWGFFQKLVIADRISILVNQVYNNYSGYPGSALLLATILFAVQIYCDFSGYSDIAIGAAQIMGINLMQNFKRPYFSASIQDFWRRWHISLSTWFRDYLYIPMGGSRCSRLKKYRNIFITFLASGIWHGASWSFVVWGGLHGIYLVIGDLLKPIKKKAVDLFKINVNAFAPRLIKIIVTFILVDFAWIFFRASSAQDAFAIINNILFNFQPSGVFGSAVFELGLNEKNFLVAALAIGVLFIVGLLRNKHSLRTELAAQNIGIRWLVYFIAIFTVIIFGIYGPGYDTSQFIYSNF